MNERRDYKISITVNSISVTRVIIDPHYELKHLNLNGMKYRLIWLLENNEIYIGVINAFRR